MRLIKREARVLLRFFVRLRISHCLRHQENCVKCEISDIIKERGLHKQKNEPSAQKTVRLISQLAE